MSRLRFVVFFGMAITIYLLLNFYIFIRGWEALHQTPLATTYLTTFVVLSWSFVAGRFLERVSLTWFSSVLVWLGSFWLAAMVYFLFAVVLVDILRLVNAIVPFIPDSLSGEAVAFAVCSMVFFVVLLGYFNARSPRIKVLDLAIPKNSHNRKELNVVVASDIHLGTIICKSRLERIVSQINALQPDVVLLPGDVVDEDIGPVIRQNLGETLRKINSRLGVFAVTGNHEYIGGVEEACRYLGDHGITMLRDESVMIDDRVYIVGREDRSIGSGRRKSLDDLLLRVDKSFPVILMDHQPFRLEEAENAGVDLQLSGHTHHGQLWPFNFITKKVYELSWGYKKKGNTHVYVSCGVGTWGPPVRTGNRPEIINMKLRFA